MKIREATSEDTGTIARLVSESNRDVALKFGLNRDNCAKHPSFCTSDWVEADFARGERYFIAEEDGDGGRDGHPIACVAYETPSATLAYLNRLSVLPEHRRAGVGTALVAHIVALARAASIRTISIGVIGEHADLQAWYRKLGFTSGETRTFPHLPFSVLYMSYAL